MVNQKSTFEEKDKNDNNLEKLLQPENEPKVIEKLSAIFSILSKNDALTIFLVAKDGLESELGTPEKVGLTKKQYYTRLKQLIDLGLINKTENKYIHTAFGNIVYEKHLIGLLNNMKISRELEMIDLLKKTSKFKPDEIANFVSKINPDALTNTIMKQENNLVIASTFDIMVKEVLELIEFAEKEILLISRFQNDLIINSILKKSQAGVNAKVISDIDLVGGYVDSAKENLAKEDRHTKERLNVVANPFYPSKIERKYAKTPFCVLLVDQDKVGIELVDNHDPQKFKMAMFGSDKQLVSQMLNMFNDMWKSAKENPPLIKQAG